MSPKITYEEALEVLQERLPYIIQKKDGQEWKNIGAAIRGRASAYDRMLEMKKEAQNRKTQFRVLPKNEADKYREGIALGRMLGPESEEDDDRRLPLMALPERI